jgi:hypothetical protein
MRLADSTVTVLTINFLEFDYEIAIYQNQHNQIPWRSSLSPAARMGRGSVL